MQGLSQAEFYERLIQSVCSIAFVSKLLTPTRLFNDAHETPHLNHESSKVQENESLVWGKY